MDAAEAWARWRPELAKAASGGHQTIDSIEADLIAGNAKLWATDDCCMVVEFHRFAGGQFACRPLFAAGDLSAIKANLAELEADARAMGCTEMLIDGPLGWQRALRDMDYEPWAVTLRKEL